MYNNLMNSYSYSNRGVTDCICIDNGCHNYLYDYSKKTGVLLNILRDTDTFSSRFISDIGVETGGHDVAISYANMQELKVMGLNLAPDFYKRYKSSLVSSYFLNSALCYSEVKKRNGKETFFVTKSYQILMTLIDQIHEADIKKIQRLKEQMTTTVKELESGVFNVVTLSADVGGFRLSKAKINTNKETVTLNTAYNLGFYTDSIIRYLKRSKVIVHYKEDEEQKVLKTSLSIELVGRWLGTRNKDIAGKAIAGTQDMYCLANIVLPNFSSDREFITINSLDITSIQRCN